MCGIIAYIASKNSKIQRIIQILMNGLIHMEYRGYDSAGICFDYVNENDKKLCLIRSVGFISDLNTKVKNWAVENNHEESVEFSTALGHTRWATHGIPSERNCHPMVSDPSGEFRVVHNGIITNFSALKSNLQSKGHHFASDTDTEVVAVLLRDIHGENLNFGFVKLAAAVMGRIEGSFALAITSRHFPGECVGIRNKSPLIVGIRDNGRIGTNRIIVKKERQNSGVFESCGDDYFLTSDACAIVNETRRIIYLENQDLVHITANGLNIYNFSHSSLHREVSTCPFNSDQIRRGNFRFFMEKEIHEQPDRIRDALRGRLNLDLGSLEGTFGREDHRIVVFGCGTSFFSAMAAKPVMQELTRCHVEVVGANEFLDLPFCLFPGRDIYIFVSQSGETADLLATLDFVKKKAGNKNLLCVTNNIGSALARECSVVLDVRAGPELGVASTKAYTCQFVMFVLLALKFSNIFHGEKFLEERRREIIDGITGLPDVIESVLDKREKIKEISRHHLKIRALMLIGRGYSFAGCHEAALKIKELSYIHASATNAGELKHGPLALVDEEASIIFFLFNDEIYEKSCNSLQQIIARKGRPVLVACGRVEERLSGSCSHVLDISRTVDCLQVVPAVVAMQLLALESADMRGLNVDRPRNLAKSVTVE